MAPKLGEILIRQELIDTQQLAQALEYQKKHGGRLGTCLTQLEMVGEKDITVALSRQYGVPAMYLKYCEVDGEVLQLIPREMAVRCQVVPLSRSNSTLTLAMADPTDLYLMDHIKHMTGCRVEPVVAPEASIAEAIEKFYGHTEEVEELDRVIRDLGGGELELTAQEEEVDLAELDRAAEEAPIVKLVNLILTNAVGRGASDIHLEPYEKEFRVRSRIDGVLQNVMAPPIKLKEAMVSRVKIMARWTSAKSGCRRTGA